MATGIRFYAIDKVRERVIPSRREGWTAGGWIGWGDRNAYPVYLYELSRTSGSLKACIDAMTGYLLGSGLWCGGVRRDEDAFRQMARDVVLYGGGAIQVHRRTDGSGVDFLPIEVRFLRTDARRGRWWYNECFGRRLLRGRDETQEFGSWVCGADTEGRDSIAFFDVDGGGCDGEVYPRPIWEAAVKAAETERAIDDFHLSAIKNGFAGSYIINFNNGIPNPETMAEIERDFVDKFTGEGNAGRVALAWNDSKENAVTVERLDVTDYGEKYRTLHESARTAIFTAFRCNPNLVGVGTDNIGFSKEEYQEAFGLYNGTVIRPLQLQLARWLGRQFGGQWDFRAFDIFGGEEDGTGA